MPINIGTAKSIPAGAVLRLVYWAVPEHYGPGDSFETEAEALEHAIEKKKLAIAKHEAFYAEDIGTSRFVPLPERITIDLRWDFRWEADPHKGGACGMDFTAYRITHDSILEAEQMLSRLTAKQKG